MQRFGGDPGILGRWFVVHNDRHDDQQFQIIGVTEASFTGVEPGRATDVWLPYAMQNPSAFGNGGYSAMRVMGRMSDGASLEQVQSVLQVAFTNFRRDYARTLVFPSGGPPDQVSALHQHAAVRAIGGDRPVAAPDRFQRPLWILTAIAALVLLIAGSNVANLFLARTAAREREMSLRLSLGAGRGRLIQQVLIESALVAGAACLIGLIFAAFAAPTVVGMLASADDPSCSIWVSTGGSSRHRRHDAADHGVIRARPGAARVEHRADHRAQGRRRTPFRPRRRRASVSRRPGGVQPDRPLRGRTAGQVLRQTVEREPRIRRVGRVARVVGADPADGVE